MFSTPYPLSDSASPSVWSSPSPVSFLGVPGEGASLPNGIVTESFATASGTETMVFTPETGSPGLYQLTSISVGSTSLPLPRGASRDAYSFAYDGSGATPTITETIKSPSSTETKLYDDGADGYVLVEDTVVQPKTSSNSYSFAADGQETVTSTYDGHAWSRTLPLDPTTKVSGLGTDTVTESIITGDRVVTDTFTGSPSAGYALSQISSTAIEPAGGTTDLNVQQFSRADFNFTNQTVTWVGANNSGQPQSMTADPNVSFTDLGAEGAATGDFVGETITGGDGTSFKIFYSSSGVGGEYMQVASGTGAASAQDLSGLVAQIAELNAVQTLTT